ncbi:MAG: cell filamentation protein Fic [Ruminiclostridium sp.]|nr:cell filamentation protein Fic [Ruminiclostridium sp.]
MNRNYEYDYEWDSRYCYPKSFVLKNKMGIRDAEQLHIAEREIAAVRILEARVNPVLGRFDLKHLQDIHRYIFKDIYEWAGDLRWVNISKGNQFCLYPYIESNADKLFNRLKNEMYLTNTSDYEIPFRLSFYLSEINVIHPFREGNGWVQRLFIQYLAENAGSQVDFSQVTGKEMIEASAEAFACDYSKMNALFQRITTPLQEPTMGQTFRLQ